MDKPDIEGIARDIMNSSLEAEGYVSNHINKCEEFDRLKSQVKQALWILENVCDFEESDKRDVIKLLKSTTL